MEKKESVFTVSTVNGIEEISVSNARDIKTSKSLYAVININTDENEGLSAMLDKRLVLDLIEKLAKVAKNIE